MATLTLIDGSGFIFRAYHALPHLSTTKGVPTNAVYGFTNMLLKALRERDPTHVALVFDAGRQSFRQGLDPTYKANRTQAPDDLLPQFPLVRDVARALNVPVLEEAGFEADDIIGTLTCRAREQGMDVVIVTGDKDFAQLVDEHVELYDPMAEATGRGGRTTPAEVEKKLGIKPAQVVEYMAILGDKIDNIPGIAGIGEVTASALIRHFGTVEAMLARPEEIPQAVARGGEKVREKIVANAERIRLNRKLVALDCAMALPFQVDDFKRREADLAAARTLFAELEFTRLVKELPPPAATPSVEKIEIVLTEAALQAAVAEWRRAGQVALRPVLNAIDGHPRSDPFVGLAVAAGGRAWYLPVGHRYLGAPAQLAQAVVGKGIAELMADPAVKKHAHDLKSAWHVLARLGATLRGFDVDSELMSALLLPSRRLHALEDVARERIRCDIPSLVPPPGPGGRALKPPPLSELPIDHVAHWAGASADAIAKLAPALRQALADEQLTKLYDEIELPVIEVLAEMERAGVLVDRGALEEMSVEFGKSLRELEDRIYAAAGHKFNIASTRELAQVLFEELHLPVVKRLKTGPSTDQEVLEKLAEQHPLPSLILEHRGIAKLKSTYVDALPQLLDPDDGRVHTTYHQGGAATGRLSSTDPNLQNIPIRTELSRRIRRAFVAPPGQVIISADYSQIELRILAHVAEDPVLIESFRNDEDIHTTTASETFGVARDAVTSDQRRIAKVLNFGIAYGLSAFGLSQRLDMPASEAQGIIDRYFARYAAVKRWLEGTIEQARRDGYVSTIYGRRRALPDIQSRNPAARQAAERMAVNTPIQGAAADIIKIAMVRLARALAKPDSGGRLLLTVHDELVVEAVEAKAEQVSEVVRAEMSGAAQLKVPLIVECGHAASWAEAH